MMAPVSPPRGQVAKEIMLTMFCKEGRGAPRIFPAVFTMCSRAVVVSEAPALHSDAAVGDVPNSSLVESAHDG